MAEETLQKGQKQQASATIPSKNMEEIEIAATEVPEIDDLMMDKNNET
jgi:hypothetical protein